MQAYRHMDIGTAKPPAEALARLPHHLVSFLDPSDQYNAGQFVTRAESLAADILSRGKIPVICGGTAFYIRSFLFGLPESPQGSPEIRARFRERERHAGHRVLYEELTRRDPEAARRIPQDDRYRIVRALEILEATGRSMFSFRWPRTLRPGYEFLTIGLDRRRDELYSRIDSRVERMFEEGLVDEVRRLIAMGYGPMDPGMRGIGYREFFEMQRGCLSLADVKLSIQRNSRRYAKRQITFFKPVPGVRWVSPEDLAVLRSLIESFIEGGPGLPHAELLDHGQGNSA